MASVVVGLMGKKQSGKDTLADYLVEKHGYTRFAFADLLRQVVYGIDPLICVERDEYYLFPGYTLPSDRAYLSRLTDLVDAIGWDQAKKIRDVRRLLQRTGTEGVRSVDDDFWWRTTMKLIDAHHGKVVITDCRFPNEVQQARQRGLVVRIERPGTDQVDQHASETAWLNESADFIVQNDGPLQGLYDWADGFAAGVDDGTYDPLLADNQRPTEMRQHPTGLFQFMDKPWSDYAPQIVERDDEDDFTVIRQRYRDALQRWHNKD
jgi:hypothetical protein